MTLDKSNSDSNDAVTVYKGLKTGNKALLHFAIYHSPEGLFQVMADTTPESILNNPVRTMIKAIYSPTESITVIVPAQTQQRPTSYCYTSEPKVMGRLPSTVEVYHVSQHVSN